MSRTDGPGGAYLKFLCVRVMPIRVGQPKQGVKLDYPDTNLHVWVSFIYTDTHFGILSAP